MLPYQIYLMLTGVLSGQWLGGATHTFSPASGRQEVRPLSQPILQADTHPPATSRQEMMAEWLVKAGIRLRDQRQFLAALQTVQRAVVIYREQNNLQGEGFSLYIIGDVYFYQAQYQQALNYYQQALVLQQKSRDRKNEGTTQNDIGLVYKRLGQYAKALEHYQRSLAIDQELGNQSGAGVTLTNMGLVYASQGRYTQALDHYQDALKLLQQFGSAQDRGLIFNNLGSTYYSLGQTSKSLNYYQQALQQYRVAKDQQGESKALNNLGLLYKQQGNYSQALKHYRQSLALTQQLGQRTEEGTVLSNIGSIHRSLGQFAKALNFYQQDLAITQQTGNRPQEATALNNIGLIYESLGDFTQALRHYHQALVLQKQVGDRAGESQTLSNLGHLWQAQNQPELAIIFYKKSVQSKESLRQELDMLPVDEQQTFTNTVADTYRTLADLLLQQDRVLEAQQILDLLKVQELDHYLRGVPQNQRPDSLLRPQERNILTQYQDHQLLALGAELGNLEQIERADRTSEQRDRILELRKQQAIALSQFQAFIASKDITALMAQLRETSRSSLELQNLQDLRNNLARLNQKAILLYPLVLEDRLELVLVSADSPPIHRSVDISRADLNQAILEFRNALRSPQVDAKPPAQTLYKWLIAPIAKDLAQAEIKTILYAPDRQLRYIPLAALHDGQHWLVETFQVNNITAASIDDLDNQPQSPPPQVLAAAFTEGQVKVDVGTQTFAFNGLTFAGPEIEAVSTLLPQTEMRINEAFGPEMVYEMNDFQIVHLATHATFLPEDPEQSFIVFGNGDHVSLADIKRGQLGWNFPNVELFVLSACETGVGDTLGSGEEILGFGYLMQLAGADASLASLWQVDDGGTQHLMGAFYQRLQQQGMTKAEALRRAQMTLIHSQTDRADEQRGQIILHRPHGKPSAGLNHPYYWAPFILIGNGL